MSAPITLLFGLTALASAAFGFMELRMLARFLKHRSAIRAAGIGRGNGTASGNGAAAPTVTIQVPLYNERTSAERIVRAAASQDYPRDRFDVQVLDDSTDETSEIVARVAGEALRDGIRIRHVRRSRRDGYKAGALAEGLRSSESEFVAVFDADFVPTPGFLETMLRGHAFDEPEVAFAQARWSWGSRQGTRWLDRALALLLDRHFHVQKPTRAYLGDVTTFNGSGGVWRRAAIDAGGGWASDTLTEDLDLSYRCALAGWRGRYLHDVKVVNELPAQMRAFKTQQRRWAKGTAQCLRKLARRLLTDSGRIRDRWEEIFLLAGYVIHPLLFASLLLWPWAVLSMDHTVFWILQGFLAVGIAGAALSLVVTVHERDGRLGLPGLGEVVSGLLVGIGLMVNNTAGLLQGLLASGGEFARTPKGGPSRDGRAEDVATPRPYASPLHWTFYSEILVASYCAAGALVLVQRGEALWAVAMALWAACLALVIQQQLGERTA